MGMWLGLGNHEMQIIVGGLKLLENVHMDDMGIDKQLR
jgi:hypothetical protein